MIESAGFQVIASTSVDVAMQGDPDPILALLPEEQPAALMAMSSAERGWRARAFILLRGAGYPSPMAWWLTMGDDEGFETDARQAISAVGDEGIAAIAASLPDEAEPATFWSLSDEALRDRWG